MRESRGGWVEQFREIALAHQRGGDRGEVHTDRRGLAEALIIAEDEQLVLDNGRADRAAELIAAELGNPRRERGPGVDVVIADELERAAVNFVAAGLQGSVDNSAAGAAELGRSDVGLYLEFLNRLRRGEEHDRVHHRLVVVQAVQGEVVGLRPRAVHHQRRAVAGAVAERLGIVPLPGGHVAWNTAIDTRNERGKLRKVASVER